MKHLLKAYEHDGITCDMRNSRKLFFPVMKEGKRIADVERSLNSSGKIIFNFNVLDSLDEETCNDLFELLSQITNENMVNTASLSSISEFSRYRRKRNNFGALIDFADNRYSLRKKDGFRHVHGKFMLIKFNGYDKIVSRETYNRLLDEDINVEYADSHNLPIILLGNETINKNRTLCYFSVDDFSKLENVQFNLGYSNECLLYFIVDNMKKTNKIILPKIVTENFGHVYCNFFFRDRKTGKPINFDESNLDLDFRNFSNVLHIDEPDDGFFTFTADLEPTCNNELSL